MISKHCAICILAISTMLAPAPLRAAAFKGAYAACQDKGLLKKAFESPEDREGKKAAAFLRTRIASGECLQFARGQQVSVDERDGAFWCVRRTGDLDCYWTLEKVVDLNPPIVSNGGGGGGQSGKRGRR
jgi:hypothetical protein